MIAQIPLPGAGVHAEMHANELPPTALHDGENWIFRDGIMRVRDGVSTIASTTGDRPNGFFGYIDDSGTPVLLMGTDDSVFTFADSTQLWVDLSASFTAGVTESTLFEAFMLGAPAGPQTTVYIQNGVDRAKYWTYGAASVSNLTAAPTAKAMMVLADRLILGNLIDHASSTYAGAVGPAVVTVSANQDPAAGYDDPTDGLVAQLLDTPGAIVAMQEIGNLQGVIYKTDAIYVMTASDGTSPFTFELKKSGVPGPVSPRAVIRASDGLQYYLARDGNVMVFDGIEPRPLGRHVQRYILDTWDIDTAYKAHGVYDDENRELIFFYPGSSSAEPNRSVTIRVDDASLWPNSYDTLRFTAALKASLPGGTTIGLLSGTAIGSMSLTLGEYDSMGQAFLFGDVGGQCYAEGGTLDDGSPINAFFETGMSGLDNPMPFKSIRVIDHLFETAADDQDVEITLMKSNYGEAPTYDDSRILNIGAGGPYNTFHRFPARRYGLRVECEATESVIWRGSTVDYAMQGGR